MYVLRKQYTLNLRKRASTSYLEFLCKYYQLDTAMCHERNHYLRQLLGYKPKGLVIIPA